MSCQVWLNVVQECHAVDKVSDTGHRVRVGVIFEGVPGLLLVLF